MLQGFSLILEKLCSENTSVLLAEKVTKRRQVGDSTVQHPAAKKHQQIRLLQIYVQRESKHQLMGRLQIQVQQRDTIRSE